MKIGIINTKIRTVFSAFACMIAASLVCTMPARAVVEININKGVIEGVLVVVVMAPECAARRTGKGKHL